MKKYAFIQCLADEKGTQRVEDEVNKAAVEGYKIVFAYGNTTIAQTVNAVWMVKEDAQ